ncbi:MAG: 3-dehydroquinate synthase [Paludibacteraceae bacterium]|nr:3-dehydroquinate synthase [Paludibacteraceae bacterium]MBR2262185.1 3-dehydroquinate synthase [Paludibacteraceae bacterium]MEE3485404.1 3-dehydroquinate synthase family protein [Bacteroidales bacterium]
MSQPISITNDFALLTDKLKDIRPANTFVLVDANTKGLCLPLLREKVNILDDHIICIPAGDDNKGLESLAYVWQQLSEKGATRKSLLLNVGGGMVTDLGGFAASTFKRGIDYINIPTTLLGAVDAAVGGKTGINFNGLKNEIGVINPAQSVLIYVGFFKTLSQDNLFSGFAEMIKHGLISDTTVWKHICSADMENIDYNKLPELLSESISVKEKIVEIDPTEKNIRKALNFGHTIGHAFESRAIERGETKLHGYAVAWGMIAELYLSYKKCGFPKDILYQAISLIKEGYGAFPITCKEYDRLYELMTHDKKNEVKDTILFTLLSNIGEVKINTVVEKQEIFEALDFYCDSVGI